MREGPDADYWSGYYKSRQAPILPSQFAAFVGNEIVSGELPDFGAIVDLGCGNGRDSFFFHQFERPVHSVDGSAAAIASCRDEMARRQDAGSLASFIARSANDPALWEEIDQAGAGKILVYARFFFHAIDDRTQAEVLDYIGALLKGRGGCLCVEARTHLDESAQKVTPEHYRRFIVPDEFARALQARGLNVRYRAEGRGMAKYREDDAHVFRVIATA